MSEFSVEMNSRIESVIASDALIIDSKKLATELARKASFENVTIGELQLAYAKSRLATALNERGYRSVIWGAGYYVDPGITDKKEFVEKLKSNADLSKKQKEDAIRLLNKAIKNNKNIDGQFEFDVDGNIVVSKSDQEILALLSKEA